jgi:hypothetical protein
MRAVAKVCRIFQQTQQYMNKTKLLVTARLQEAAMQHF